MLNARTERRTVYPIHSAPVRGDVLATPFRTSTRTHHGAGRSVFLDTEHMTGLASGRGSMFEAMSPERI